MGLYRVYIGFIWVYIRNYIIGFRTSIMKNRKKKNMELTWKLGSYRG